MFTRRLIATGVAALALVAGACGGDDDTSSDEPTENDGGNGGAGSADRQEYVDAIVGLAEEDDDDVLDADKRTCVAESYVDGYGVDEMAADGVTPEDIENGDLDAPGDIGLDFSQEQADDFYDRLQDCMDIRAVIIESAASDDVPQEALDCIDGNLDDDLLERFIVTGFTKGDAGFDDDPELEAELEAALAPCMEMGQP